jgi:hypothetical protein
LAVVAVIIPALNRKMKAKAAPIIFLALLNLILDSPLILDSIPIFILPDTPSHRITTPMPKVARAVGGVLTAKNRGLAS